MTVLKWIVIVAALIYLGSLAVLYFKQRDMLFPIPPVGRTLPAAAGLPEAEEHVVTTADGEKVIIWHLAAKPGRRVVLYFPGNGDALAYLAGRLRSIASDGSGVIALSYRGYAGSSGRPSEQGILADAAAVYRFASARYDPNRIVAWGHSLGSGVAVAIAADHRLGGLILEAPFTSIAEVAAAVFPYFPVRYLMKDPFRSDERILQVRAPLLIMHGARDSTIPIRFAELLFALAHQPKQFVRFDQGEHNDLDDFGAIETARQFIGGLKG